MLVALVTCFVAVGAGLPIALDNEGAHRDSNRIVSTSWSIDLPDGRTCTTTTNYDTGVTTEEGC